MRDELAIILLDDFCPIQQLNAKSGIFASSAQPNFAKLCQALAVIL